MAKRWSTRWSTGTRGNTRPPRYPACWKRAIWSQIDSSTTSFEVCPRRSLCVRRCRMLRSHALEKGRVLTWEVEAAPSLSRMAPAPALAAKASAVEEERLGLHGRFETLPVWNIEGL